jgi:hypothetical protein
MPTADPGTQQPYPADYGYYGQEAFAQPQGKTYTYPAPTYPAAAAGFKVISLTLLITKSY